MTTPLAWKSTPAPFPGLCCQVRRSGWAGRPAAFGGRQIDAWLFVSHCHLGLRSELRFTQAAL